MHDLLISCAADANYVGHSAAMLHSALVHSPSTSVEIHYLHDPALGDDEKAGLEQMVKRYGGAVHFHAVVDDAVEELPAVGHLTRAAWYRILLPDLLPTADKILYLDIDTLVVDDLVPLWTVDLADHNVAAVANVFQHNHRHRPASLGIPDGQNYFNSGVLLMNLAVLRQRKAETAIRRCALEYGDRLEWVDQDALNVVLGDRWLPLHPRWNCMNSVLCFEDALEVFGEAAVEEAREHPAIRHFEGPALNKPWHRAASNETQELYAMHRRNTPWPEYVPDGRPPSWRTKFVRRAIGRRN